MSIIYVNIKRKVIIMLINLYVYLQNILNKLKIIYHFQTNPTYVYILLFSLTFISFLLDLLIK